MTLVERVARAMVAGTAEITGQRAEDSWQVIGPMTRVFMCQMARAAIEAMRDPTDAMMQRGYDEATANGDQAEEGDFVPRITREVWSSMIDAALKEEP